MKLFLAIALGVGVLLSTGLGALQEAPQFGVLQSERNLMVPMRKALAAGATIVKPAADTFWGGYAGYFLDPDAHVWEVVWNPQWVVED